MRYRLAFDTNVLFSALFFGKKAGEALYTILANQHYLICSEYIRDELLEVIRRKGLSVVPAQKLFALSNVKTLPDSTYASRKNFDSCKKIIRDEKDVPVLAFAKHALENNLVDFFISGDNDLLEPKVRRFAETRILSLSEFLARK